MGNDGLLAVGLMCFVVIFGWIIVSVLINADSTQSVKEETSPVPIDNKQQKLIESDELFKNYLTATQQLCEKSPTCTELPVLLYGEFYSKYPELDSNNGFDIKYCDAVSENGAQLFQSGLHLNRDDFSQKPYVEYWNHVTALVIEEYGYEHSYYDEVYDMVQATDELYLFWKQAYRNSCL